MKKYAYVRVSTKEQNIDRQILALESYKIPKKNIYCDYQSGKNFERPAYQKLIRKLKKGDLLIIKSIDRLGRNYNEILTQWQYITKEIKADILVLDMDLLDTRKKSKRGSAIRSFSGNMNRMAIWTTAASPLRGRCWMCRAAKRC